MNQDFECPRCGHCCQALEEKQEPVAYVSSLDFDDDDQEIISAKDKGKLGTSNCNIPLYTAPKQWVGLTDDEIEHIADSEWEEAFVRMIEAKLKEKNT